MSARISVFVFFSQTTWKQLQSFDCSENMHDSDGRFKYPQTKGIVSVYVSKDTKWDSCLFQMYWRAWDPSMMDMNDME